MIPDAEADLLMNTVTDAIEKVAEGRLAEEYDLLETYEFALAQRDRQLARGRAHA